MACNATQATAQQAAAVQTSVLTVPAQQAVQPTENNDPDEDEEAEDGDEEYDSEYDSVWGSVDSLEAEFDDFGELWWMEDGEVQHWFENPYVEGVLDRYPTYDLRWIYSKMTARELRKAVQDRGLADPYPQGLTMKYFYVRTLERADANARFRLLFLPPEMRNLIYTELLTIRGRRCHCGDCPAQCFTEILRTCRHVHEEAKDILYAVNRIKCKFTVNEPGYPGKPSCAIQIHHDKYRSVQPCTSFASYTKSLDMFPSFLLRVWHIKISVAFHGSGSPDLACSIVRRCLMGLVSFLMDGHELRRLSLKLSDHLGAAPHLVEHILYPLRRLRSIPHALEPCTGVRVDCKREILAEMHDLTSCPLNTIRHYKLLMTEASTYKSIQRALSPFTNGSLMDEELTGPFEHVSDEIAYWHGQLLYEAWSLDKPGGDPFGTAEEELNSRRLMDNLRKALHKVFSSGFKVRLHEFLDSRQNRWTYFKEHGWVDAPSAPEDVAKGVKTPAHARRKALR